MHVRRALALAVSVPLLLAGCSDDPEPTPKIPDPTTSSPTDPVTETETPEAESPEDFIRRWISVNTEMQNTGDTDAYLALSAKCRPCKATADRVEEIYAGGGFVRTKGWIVRGVMDQTGASGGPILDLAIESSPTEYKESPDAALQSLPGGQLTMRVRLNKAQPWQVVQLTQVAS